MYLSVFCMYLCAPIREPWIQSRYILQYKHACGGWVRCEYKRILAHQGVWHRDTKYVHDTSKNKEIQSNTGGASCMYPAYIRPPIKRFVTTRGWWVTCLLVLALRLAGRDLIPSDFFLTVTAFFLDPFFLSWPTSQDPRSACQRRLPRRQSNHRRAPGRYCRYAIR